MPGEQQGGGGRQSAPRLGDSVRKNRDGIESLEEA